MNALIIVMMISMPTGSWGILGPHMTLPGFKTIEACQRAIPKLKQVWHFDWEAKCVALEAE